MKEIDHGNDFYDIYHRLYPTDWPRIVMTDWREKGVDGFAIHASHVEKWC